MRMLNLFVLEEGLVDPGEFVSAIIKDDSVKIDSDFIKCFLTVAKSAICTETTGSRKMIVNGFTFEYVSTVKNFIQDCVVFVDTTTPMIELADGAKLYNIVSHRVAYDGEGIYVSTHAFEEGMIKEKYLVDKENVTPADEEFIRKCVRERLDFKEVRPALYNNLYANIVATNEMSIEVDKIAEQLNLSPEDRISLREDFGLPN